MGVPRADHRAPTNRAEGPGGARRAAARRLEGADLIQGTERSVRRPDGARLHVETYGDPEREPLVLLEGMGGEIPGWRRNIPRLSTGCFVVAYDHRGNGRSTSADRPLTMDDFVEDGLAVLDALGIRRAHVYGQSFGGMVAIELALGRRHSG